MENIIEKVIYIIFNYKNLEIISKGKNSGSSTLGSNNNTKDVDTDETNINPLINQEQSLFICKIFNSYSTKNMNKRNNLCNLEFSPIKNIKNFKSKKLITYKKFLNKNENNFFDLKKFKKANCTNKKSLNEKRKSKRKINIINASIPINKISNQNKKIRFDFKKAERIKIEQYTQTINMSCLKEIPPKVPEIFNHNYNLENINKANTYGVLNKEKVPIIFYNHLMLSSDKINFLQNKNKFFKTLITKRNKNKMLTIIYYTPKQRI